MKSLSLSTPHVVVMVGLPGAGKSFFANHFAETFSAPIISWDTLRDELLNAPTYAKEEDAVIKRVADEMLAQLLKTKATVLYEGDVLTQASRQALARTIRKEGYEPLFVWVQTDAATTRSRATKQGIPLGAVEAAEKRFTPLKSSDNFIVISGKHTYASQLKIVLRKLSGDRASSSAARPSRDSDKPSVGRRLTVQ